MLRNQVQLITYPDSLGGTISDVERFITEYLQDAIGGVHILPFYPSSADRGFAPLTHLSVDPAFGTWEDIRRISTQYDLVVDLTVNHLSYESEYFQDYLANGDGSPYASMFLEVDAFLERHEAELDSLSGLYRPHPSLPFTTFKLWDGTTKRIWTTFTNHQVDLDVESPKTRLLMQQFIDTLVANGANLIRLDAVGYTVKRPHTNSFLIPETYDFIEWLRSVTPSRVDLLAEIHHDPQKQMELLASNSVEWVYDFSLPLLVLHALQVGNCTYVRNWISIRPSTQITTLDTHDGIGVIDVQGLLPQSDIDATVSRIEHNGANAMMRANGLSADNLDIYQINTTYYSALGEDDDAYITARAIQFFIPGIPQVYYVGLLAGSNDHAAFAKTNHGRDVNRHNYTHDEIKEVIQRPVVQRLLRLMRLRSNHPAFQGDFTLKSGTEEHVLALRWEHEDVYCEATIDVQQKTVHVELVHPHTKQVEVEQY